MRKFSPLILCAGFCLGAISPVMASEPFSIDTLLKINRLSDSQLSPDGSKVVFVLRETDLDANKGRTDLWLLDVKGEQRNPRRLTTHQDADNHPRWSADGQRIYFLSNRTGSRQVWQLALEGGEAQQVTDLPVSVSDLVVSPSGKHLAFTARVYPECKDLACSQKREAQISAEKAKGRVYDRLFFRHWDEWEDGQRSRLFTQAIDKDGDIKGKPIMVSAEINGDVPAVPFGSTDDIAFTRDGKNIIFSTRLADRDEAWSTNYDLYFASVGESKGVKNITADNKAYDAAPVLSPDGKWLAYLAMQRPGYEADRQRIVLKNLLNGESRTLTEDWDRSVETMVFAQDSQSLYIRARDIGQRPLWKLDLAAGSVPIRLTGEGYVNEFMISKDRIIYSYDNLKSPADLFSISLDGKDVQQLTAVNKKLLSKTLTGEYEQFSFAGADNEKVYGYVVKPVGYKAGKQYPIAYIVHGGPQGSFSNHFGYRWNPQFYAGAGFAAVFIDFHGSTGYGQAFTDSINGDWGGKPFVDMQKGLAAAIEKYKWLDGNNACALGASYGGYAMNWIAGNWPERFKCIVNHAGIFDNRAMYYSTEELWFVEWDHQGPYYKNPTSHEKHNPVLHVDQWQTPMLVIQGGKDFRVPETQSMATFTALQRRGIPSRFLYFPDENHWINKPHNSKQWHEEVDAWLRAYLKK